MEKLRHKLHSEKQLHKRTAGSRDLQTNVEEQQLQFRTQSISLNRCFMVERESLPFSVVHYLLTQSLARDSLKPMGIYRMCFNSQEKLKIATKQKKIKSNKCNKVIKKEECIEFSRNSKHSTK